MNAMKVYSREEMIALWRKVMNIDVARRECSVERADGIDVDALLQQHIDVWYGNLPHKSNFSNFLKFFSHFLLSFENYI